MTPLLFHVMMLALVALKVLVALVILNWIAREPKRAVATAAYSHEMKMEVSAYLCPTYKGKGNKRSFRGKQYRVKQSRFLHRSLREYLLSGRFVTRS